MFCFGSVVESFAEKQGIGRAHRIGQLNKNVVRFIKKHRRGKIIRLQENKNFFRMHCWMKPHQP
jgi:SNF2 family DNA or RNA helicase